MANTLFTNQGVVQDHWLDYNGHMNVGYYGVAMDDMSNGYFEHLQIGMRHEDQIHRL